MGRQFCSRCPKGGNTAEIASEHAALENGLQVCFNELVLGVHYTDAVQLWPWLPADTDKMSEVEKQDHDNLMAAFEAPEADILKGVARALQRGDREFQNAKFTKGMAEMALGKYMNRLQSASQAAVEEESTESGTGGLQDNAVVQPVQSDAQTEPSTDDQTHTQQPSDPAQQASPSDNHDVSDAQQTTASSNQASSATDQDTPNIQQAPASSLQASSATNQDPPGDEASEGVAPPTQAMKTSLSTRQQTRRRLILPQLRLKLLEHQAYRHNQHQTLLRLHHTPFPTIFLQPTIKFLVPHRQIQLLGI
jgi:hypothetical protein